MLKKMLIKIQGPQSLQEFAPRIQDQFFENGHLINSDKKKR